MDAFQWNLISQNGRQPHRMQITSFPLLETSAVSPAMIVKNVEFWMFADTCCIMPGAIASSSSSRISGDVYFSSFPPPLNDLSIFLSPASCI